ncbi:MAG: hypothetical protein ACOYMA_00155 [Bacteroidia bacterium]
MNKSNLIAISGKLRHGKDTFANIIVEELNNLNFNKEIYKTAFADQVKETLLSMCPTLDRKHVFGPSEFRDIILPNCIDKITGKPLTIRNALIQIGAMGREWNKDFWAMAVLNKLQNNKLMIITDCRYLNEKESIEMCGGKVIRIIRQLDNNCALNHLSETDLDNANFDDYVINDTIDNLHKQAIKMINKYIL